MLWVGTNRETDCSSSIQTARVSPDIHAAAGTFPDDHVWFFRIRKENLWEAMSPGFSGFRRDPSIWELSRESRAIRNSLRSNKVHSVYAANENFLVGTAAGLHRLDRKTGQNGRLPARPLTACGGTPRKLVAAVSMQRTTDYADSVPESSSNVDNGVCNRFT